MLIFFNDSKSLCSCISGGYFTVVIWEVKKVQEKRLLFKFTTAFFYVKPDEVPLLGQNMQDTHLFYQSPSI